MATSFALMDVVGQGVRPHTAKQAFWCDFGCGRRTAVSGGWASNGACAAVPREADYCWPGLMVDVRQERCDEQLS